MAEQPAEPSLEYLKWKHTKLEREDAQRAHDTGIEFANAANAAAVESGSKTLQAGLLINGGAAISYSLLLEHWRRRGG